MRLTPATGVRISAHRGDSHLYRENTLPAIHSAIAGDADLVEIDVQLTADEVVIVLHDSTLNRLWGVDAAVRNLTSDEILALGGPDERPPLLSEVLRLFEGSPSTLFIDVSDPMVASHAWRETRSSTAAVTWCGETSAMVELRRLDPEARIWLAWDELSLPTEADIAPIAPESINVNYFSLTAALVQRTHELGCVLTVWTIDDSVTMSWARDLGVDVMTTNDIRLLRQVLDEPGNAPDPTASADHRVAAGDDPLLTRAAIIARGLARWAIHFVRKADLGAVKTKADGADLVTEIDLAIETHVRAIISHHFPDHAFVGEEFGGAPVSGVPCWYLDPVDGTANLANGIPWTSFSLALAIDGQPVVGAVADPWREEIYEAQRGAGAFLNGERLRIAQGSHSSDGDPLQGRIVLTELANHVPWPGMLTFLKLLGQRYCTLRIMGSGTLTLTGIAAGRGAGAVIGSFGPLDHLAATLTVAEAGGVVRDESGQANLFPQSGGIMAAAPDAADALGELWARARESGM